MYLLFCLKSHILWKYKQGQKGDTQAQALKCILPEKNFFLTSYKSADLVYHFYDFVNNFRVYLTCSVTQFTFEYLIKIGFLG